MPSLLPFGCAGGLRAGVGGEGDGDGDGMGWDEDGYGDGDGDGDGDGLYMCVCGYKKGMLEVYRGGGREGEGGTSIWWVGWLVGWLSLLS